MPHPVALCAATAASAALLSCCCWALKTLKHNTGRARGRSSSSNRPARWHTVTVSLAAGPSLTGNARHSSAKQQHHKQTFEVVLLPLSCSQAEAVLASDRGLTAAHVIGLDCEWVPERRAAPPPAAAASSQEGGARGQRQHQQHSPVSLLQLCAGSTCYLAQLMHMDGVPSQLRYILENPLVVKVGVGIREDVRRLQRDYGIRVASAVELGEVLGATHQPASLLAKKGGTGLAALSRTLLGLELDKTLQCSDWGAVQLSQQQLTYAALDAWVSLQLAQRLLPALVAAQQHQHSQCQQQSESASTSSSSSSNSGGRQLSASTPWAAADAQASTTRLAQLLRPFAAKPGAGTRNKQQQQQHQHQHQHAVHSQHTQWRQHQHQQQRTPPAAFLQHGPRLPQRNAARSAPPSPAHVVQQQQQQAAAVMLRLQQLSMLPLGQQVVLLWRAGSQLLQLQQRAGPTRQQQQQQEGNEQRQQRRQAQRDKQQPLEQEQHTSDAPSAAAAASAASTQQRRQQQLEQLARLGLSSQAPRSSIYDRLHQLKPARMPTRKSTQYENCRILSPEGVGLATCGLKKVRWYLERGLAELVSEEPAVIRLKFKPKGSGHADDAYYLSDKTNQCVVCGHPGDYLRHHIVPHSYRAFFPTHMKSHLSHDIVLLCAGCHQVANVAAQAYMRELGVRYGAPLEDASRRYETDKSLSAVRSAAKALSGKAAARIPPARMHELQAVIVRHFGGKTQQWPGSVAEQQQLLQAALAVDPRSVAAGWQPHAAVVVAAVIAEGEQQQQQQLSHVRNGMAVPTARPVAAAAEPAWFSPKPPTDNTAVTAMQQLLIAIVAVCVGGGAAAGAAAANAAGLQLAAQTAVQAVLAVSPPPPAAAPLSGAEERSSSSLAVDASSLSLTDVAAEEVCSKQPLPWQQLPHRLSSAAAYGFHSLLIGAAAAAASLSKQRESASARETVAFSNGSSSSLMAVTAVANTTNTAAAEAAEGSSNTGATAQGTSAASTPTATAADTQEQQQQQQQQISAAGEAALEEFVRAWRQHFLDTMQPRFLPRFWSVDSRVKNSSSH